MHNIINKEIIKEKVANNKMKYCGKNIFTNKKDYCVCLSFTSDPETQKQQFKFIVVAPDGRLSAPVRMKKARC